MHQITEQNEKHHAQTRLLLRYFNFIFNRFNSLIMGKVTVQQMIDSLKQFPADANLEIQIFQSNQRYSVATCAPQQSTMVDGCFAQMRDGVNVRIGVTLPYDGETMMITQTRKIK